MARANTGRNRRKRVAIIGSGCAGLGVAWALQSTEHDVTIFEKADRIGGHTNTQKWEHKGQVTPVDTGFIVMNSATYPNLLRFLREIEVDIARTSMTFGVSRDHGLFEWSGTGSGIFAQKRNIFSPRMWRMIFDIVRFNQFALDLLGDEVSQSNGHDDVGSDGEAKDTRTSKNQEQSIGDYLKQEGYSRAFTDDYLIPMTAAVWSTSPDKASLDFPAITLVRFMWNHHLLSTIATRPDWLTIPGGSQRYIDGILKRADATKFRVHTSTAVTGVTRTTRAPVKVSFKHSGSHSEQTEEFDHVVFACHGDEILPILSSQGDVRPEEKDILQAFQTTENIAYLHSDISLMPKRRAVWTAWNYLISSAASKLDHPAGVSLTYWMNDLQHISEDVFGPVLVTMNPEHPPAPEQTQGEYTYRHPLYTAEAVRAQQRLESLQNADGISYCGAWTKYGFHEDGFSSGLKVAIEHLGADLPFEFVDSTFSRGKAPALGQRDHVLRAFIVMIQRVVAILDLVIMLPPIALALNILSGLVQAPVRKKIE